MAIIKSITYKPQDIKQERGQVGYLRQVLNEANLLQDYGIEGDRKGGNPKRNLNIMDDVTLAQLKAEGYPTEPGALGENLILTGIDLRTLPDKAQLRLGAEAVIEVLKPREPCEQLTPLDGRMPESVVGRVGMMCRVVMSGKIKVGDQVVVIAEMIAK